MFKYHEIYQIRVKEQEMNQMSGNGQQIHLVTGKDQEMSQIRDNGHMMKEMR